MVRLSATFRLLWHCIPKSRFLFTFIRILLLALAILPLCWQYFRVIVTCQTSIQSHSFVKLPPRNCFILFVTDCECGILSSVFVLISRVVLKTGAKLQYSAIEPANRLISAGLIVQIWRLLRKLLFADSFVTLDA